MAHPPRYHGLVPCFLLGRLEDLEDIRRISLGGEVFPGFPCKCEAAGGLQYERHRKPCANSIVAVLTPTTKRLRIYSPASMTCTTHVSAHG